MHRLTAALSVLIPWVGAQAPAPDPHWGANAFPEARTALRQGRRLKKAKLILAEGSRQWIATLDASTMTPFVTWGTMLLLGLFYLLTVYLDLFIGIAVVMLAMCLLWGERRLHVALGVALLTPLCVFALFDKVLQIRFPRGILTNWYYG